jgi:hypothetical protein
MWSKKQNQELGMVAYACNPSYLKGRDWEDNSWRPIGQNVRETTISTNSQGQCFSLVIPVKWEALGRIVIQGWPLVKNVRPYQKNN